MQLADPFRRAVRFSALVAFPILSASCISDAPAAIGNVSRIRVVNVISDGQNQPVDVFLDGSPFGQGLPFGASTPLWLPPPRTANYANVPWGNHSITLTRTSNGAIVAQYDISLTAIQDRTFYAVGVGGFFPQETLDDNVAPDPGTIRLRVANMTSSIGAVDVFVTTPSADLAAATPQAVAVQSNGASAYFAVAPGTWQVRTVRSGVAPAARAANVVLTMNDQTWDRGGRTIVVAEILAANGGFIARGVILADQ